VKDARLSASAVIRRLGAILLVSGFCSLVYQVIWLRLLRLVFGASTASTAAVLAIFMGGLGLGGLWLGRRVDRSPRPLVFYTRLELGIAASAALTPPLVELIRWIYVSLGGTPQLGLIPGTLLRLGLSAVVLGLPAFFMGGTLPAAVRAIERTGDRSRRGVGLFYGVNTLGAVLGTLWATFVSVELVGLRRSIWVAALLNLLIVVLARALARRVGVGNDGSETGRVVVEAGDEGIDRETAEASADVSADVPGSRFRLRLVLVAAFLVGFVFFLMELVWYRMLAPLLGGSSYTFGLILAVALTGIGGGGLIYGQGARERRPTLATFAGTCALLAMAVAFPLALGDRIAFLALATRDLGQAGLAGMVLGWSLVTVLVVLPASLVAGYQFPVLVGLLGTGRRNVGREVGLAYAWNTAGAILGSVAGGFGLLPLLTAPGAWRLSAALLAALALLYLAAARFRVWVRLEADPLPARSRLSVVRTLLPAVLALTALAMLRATGPTAAWRHTGIGAGRLEMPDRGPNGVRAAFTRAQTLLVWEQEGIESSVALRTGSDYSFQINGKTDGSALGDAGTQVMSGLVGALLHPEPHTALVIGLGTGSSAGWLADVPGIERVDVVELEPAVRRVAEWMAPVNRNALANPRLRLLFGDAREYLLTTGERYDILFSEPSNPYRAGISSLFTREFYRAAADRLEPGGIFLQWLQAYEVDSSVIRTAYTTLSSVFPHVETWQVHSTDLLLVASETPIPHDAERIRWRTAKEPFASALLDTWGVSGLEGFYTGYLAGPGLAREIASQRDVAVNTDDRPLIEFGFVRNLGRKGLFSVDKIEELAHRGGYDRPPVAEGVDPDRIRDLTAARMLILGAELPEPDETALGVPPDPRMEARRAYARGDYRSAVGHWFAQPEEPHCRADLVLLAHSLARLGDPRALDYAQQLRELRPLEADAVLAIWHTVRREAEPALELYLSVFETCRNDPWIYPPLLSEVMESAVGMGRNFPEAGRRIFDALSQPFAVGLLDETRLRSRLGLAAGPNFEPLCVEALAPLEPHPFWEWDLLARRAQCYVLHDHPLKERALDDAAAYLATEPPPLLEENPPQVFEVN
jgi:spermidine synthase